MVAMSFAHGCVSNDGSEGPHAVVVTRIGMSTVDTEALTIDGEYGQAINGKSLRQDAILSHLVWQYLAYYDAQRRISLARWNLPDG